MKLDQDHSYPYFRSLHHNIRSGYYPFIGKGSGRIVYDIGGGKVVKSAKNMRGIAQNIEEFRIGLRDASGILARVSDASADYHYLIMEKAGQISDISIVWDYFGVESNYELFQIRRLQELSDRYDLLIQDFGRAANWGLVHQQPVIIDYGFTRSVRQKYYAAKRGRKLK